MTSPPPAGRVGSVTALRPITAADEEFLRRVYASTREAELALVDWDEAQKAAFVRMQFDAQHRYYQDTYPHGRFQVVVVDDRAAGRLYLNQSSDDISVIDIAMLPEFQARGVGTALLSDVLAEASTLGLPVTIHVERNNPALAWYRRLGFAVVEDRGVYLFMRCEPKGPATCVDQS